jgi:predicted nuclease with TOPRIM domain
LKFQVQKIEKNKSSKLRKNLSQITQNIFQLINQKLKVQKIEKKRFGEFYNLRSRFDWKKYGIEIMEESQEDCS